MIYYVEDDANIRDLTIYALKQAGYEACGFSNADDFFIACNEREPDVVLLDIMLPGKDGIEILQELRQHPTMKYLPVMMLTAKGTEIDTVSGLDAGADDYLAKPFGMMEMVSRVRALLRRAQAPATQTGNVIQCGPITLDIDAHAVAVSGMDAQLTLKEFDLLQALMENEGHVLTREQLLANVWGYDFSGNTRTVDVHVQTLRQKLAQAAPHAGELIHTIRGVGYCIKAYT